MGRGLTQPGSQGRLDAETSGYATGNSLSLPATWEPSILWCWNRDPDQVEGCLRARPKSTDCTTCRP